MLEHMNQVVKHSALRNNFRNTLLTSSTRLAEKIAFDIYCGAHAGSNQVELEVSCLEECSQGTSPTIDHLIRLGVLRLATPDGTLEVKWLRKAKLSKSAFTPGDYVQTSTGHVALLMDLFQVNGTIIFQLCLLAQGPHSRDDLKLTWALLEAATCAPLWISVPLLAWRSCHCTYCIQRQQKRSQAWCALCHGRRK